MEHQNSLSNSIEEPKSGVKKSIKPSILDDVPEYKLLLSGNEAVARGAIEAGVRSL